MPDTVDKDTDRWRELEAIVDDLLGDGERRGKSRRLASGDPLFQQRIADYLVRSTAAGPIDRSLGSQVGDLLHVVLKTAHEEFLEIGEEVGAYRIESVIGEGGMGTVFLARRADGSFDQEVALKLLHRGPTHQEAHRRFLQERQILAGLRHPNIARLLDGGVIRGLPYLVMERIDGQPITLYCEQKRLGREDRVRLILQACDAIRYAHRQGVIHRDLKPSNLLVEEGPKGEAKLVVLDFGIALIEHAESRVTSTGQIFGTPGYMSAEQAIGNRSEVDRRSDVFSLGVVLYELLSGWLPFGDGDPMKVLQRVMDGKATPLKQRLPSLSSDLATITETCIAREPANRYDSVRALAEDLESFLDGGPIAARPVNWLGRWRRRARRQPKIAALAFSALVLPLASLVLLVTMTVQHTRALAVERNTAVEARADVEALLDFMLEDLHEGLDRIGRLDLLEQVAVRSLEYYARRPIHGSADEIRGRSVAILNTGAILEDQGELEQASRAYEQNLRFFSELMRVDPLPQWRLELARSHQALASALAADSDFVRALEHAASALTICRQLGDLEPPPEDWPEVYFNALALSGWIMREVDTASRALEVLDEAQRFAAGQAALSSDEDWNFRQTLALSYTGLVHHQAGALSQALASFHPARESCERFLKLDPANSRWRAELQLVLGRIGSVWLDLGEPRTAIDVLEEARRQSDVLVEVEPENARWIREKAVTHSMLAAARRAVGDLPAALEDLKKSLAISRTLLHRFPKRHSIANDLSWDLLDLGRILRALGDLDESNSALNEAVEVIRKTRGGALNSPFYLDTEVQALLELGRIEEARPLVKELHEMGWKAADFLELVAQHGLEAESFSNFDESTASIEPSD